jgi:GT2 family glycosyltransferase
VKALTDPDLARDVAVLLWDNSPSPLIDPELPFAFQYGWTAQNLGTAGAYNQGITLAAERGIPWMLLLDQDTDVTAEFLQVMARRGRALEGDARVGSIVPFIRSCDQIVSPRRFRPLNRNTAVERTASGLLQEDAYAVNSGSLMRVSALQEIGGYSNDFWLDLSDVYAFQQMYQRGYRVFIAGDLELNHAIAGMNFQQEMVPERYETFLAAESAYLQMHRSRIENLVQSLWLPMRAIRQWRQYADKRYAKITWRYFVMRLTKSPAARLQIWREYLRSRRSIPTPTPSADLSRESTAV